MDIPTFLAEQYQVVMESLNDGLYVVDTAGHIQFCNPALARLSGYRVEELLGRPSTDLYSAETVAVILERRRRALRGEAVASRIQVELLRRDGQRVPVELSIATLMRDGQITGRITVVRDMTERLQMEAQARRLSEVQAARAEIEAAHQRLTFLAETSTILSSATDYSMMLDSLARCIVPYMADWCVIDMLEEDGWVHRMALTHKDPQKRGLLQELKSRYPRLPLDAEHTLLGVLRTQRAWLRPELPEAQGRAEARDARHWQILQGLGYGSEMVVPLIARGRVLGTITFVVGPTARRYGPSDLALAEDLARRCAVAVDNARLYQQARQAEVEAERRRREAEVLAHLAQSLGASLDLGVVLQRVVEAAQELCGSERALIFLREPGAEVMALHYQVGPPEMAYESLLIEPGKGIGGQALLTGRPQRTVDYAADPRFSKDYLDRIRRGGQLAVITVPITIGSRVEGVLYVSNQASHPFTERHEAILLRLADLAATAIRNAQLYREAASELARRIEAEEALKASLREKEVLLKEIHHRVKNNLQIISSLLSLQAGYREEPHLQAMFADSQHRIQSMALIHEQLYQASDLARIDFGSYVQRLAVQLLGSYRSRSAEIRLSTDMAEVLLSIDQAIPCGLLVNELLTNALKHAFPEGRGGTIRIALQGEADQVTLVVQDTGIGFPDDIDFRTTDSLGLQLVCALTEQLQGKISLEPCAGTLFRITFPISCRE